MSVLLALLAAATVAVPGIDEDAEVRRAVASAPPAIRTLVRRRAGCNHWEGEDAYDAARSRQIASAMRRLRCNRLDADEELLRRRHARRPADLRLIDRTRDFDGAL